ncbi:MAG: ABC-2 transporter permease, partial [Oscillospiraceae bacterium]|nr:ABC-2 transporter permease [Oscillospiraceae bacterium]
MNGVKGLIIKEIYLRWKTLLSGLAIFVLLFILAASFCLSFDYGNMKNNEELDRETTTVILSYAVAGMGILLFGQNAETIIKDKKCKWNIFEHTLPLSAQKLAAVRIGLLLASSILGLIVSTMFSWILFVLAHKEFTLTVFANISVISIFVFALMTFANFMNL